MMEAAVMDDFLRLVELCHKSENYRVEVDWVEPAWLALVSLTGAKGSATIRWDKSRGFTLRIITSQSSYFEVRQENISGEEMFSHLSLLWSD